MRAWLCLHAFDIDFEEIFISLNHPQLDKELTQYSSSAKVPVLLDGDICIWDSLAIAEYILQYYAPQALPEDTKQRAQARSLCAQMHASFYYLRKELPMNIRAKRQISISPRAQKDIQHIETLWQHYSTCSKNGWLFDSFSIADCMYAPIASRFKTYEVDLCAEAKAYQHKILNHPSVILWCEQACLETEIVAEDETGTEINGLELP